MRQLCRFGCLAAALALISLAAPAAEKAGTLPDGNYKITSSGTYGSEATDWIIKIENKGGKAAGSLVAANPRWETVKAQLGARYKEPAVESVTVAGNVVRIVVKNYLGTVETFEATLGDNAKKIRGVMGSERFIRPAWLAATEATALQANEVLKPTTLEPYKQVQADQTKVLQLQTKLQQTRDAEERAKLLDELRTLSKEFQEKKLPEAHEKVLGMKDVDEAVTLGAAMGLLRTATATKAAPHKVKDWAMQAEKAATAFGPRLVDDTRVQQAEVLATIDGLAELAVEQASKAEKALPKEAKPAQRIRVLNALASAQRKAGLKADLEATMGRIAKVDADLDKEYLATMPPFKGEKFTGKTSKKPVVLELFTGAQCPPCVAADIAFDVLLQTYEPRNLIALQYHQHIPGPDPLTNADTVARWDYYVKAFPQEFRGVPSMAINGLPGTHAGGSMEMAKNSYDNIRRDLEKKFEDEAGCELQAKATRSGDKIDISVEVKGLKTPGEDMKLRLVLVEENVAYAGSNGIRFHHHIVRDMPGGPAGVTVKDKNFTHTASVDLGQLRKKLTSYLDDYAENKRAFPNPKRPMEMKHLSVVAIVQDETLHEIVQAVQVEVSGK